MDKKILEFANVLRRSGIRVSTAEALDAFAAVDELSFDEREVFKDALRATLVKRGDEVATFDAIFELFWSGLHERLRRAFDEAAGGVLAPRGLDLEDLLGEIAQVLQGAGGDLSQLARAMLTADLARLEARIRAALEAVGASRMENFLQIGFFSRRALERTGAEAAAQELREFAARLEAAGLPRPHAEALRQLADALLGAMRRSVRAFVEREFQTHNHEYLERYRREALLEKSFYQLTEKEMREMREVVERLAQRIKNVLSIRRRRLKRGKLDLHQTLRRNMSRGAIPFERVFKQRRRDRPKLVILCDVSSSVANVSRFMLQFVYTLQEAFTKIRSFVFVAELGDVTRIFQEREINSAIDEALRGGRAINVYTRSNFGAAFRSFWRDHLSSVDPRTTVLILGDARNNYHDPRAWCLREIRRKAKNVVWLNPESPGAWGFGDSAMHRYRPYCDVAEECRNLRQLAALVDRLVLTRRW